MERNHLAQVREAKTQAGTPVLDLTESNPTRAGFVYPAAEIIAALADPRAMSYEPLPQGLLSAREAVADYYRAHNEAVSPEQICLTASTSEAYAWIFKLLANHGDNVLVPQPSYPLFDFLAALEGVELRPYPLEYTHPAGWRIDFDSLHRAATQRTRAVIVVSPNNPTGSFLTGDELERLRLFCVTRGLALIVDEVFADYVFRPETAGAGAFTAESAVLTFVLNGLSKTLGLPQMKLGWIITTGPEVLRQEAIARLELIADTFLSVNTPVQCALPTWLGLRENIQSQIQERVLANLEWLAAKVDNSAGRLLTTEGGWSAILEVPRIYSEEEWTLRLLAEDNVLVHPGYFFDFMREAFLIISLLTPAADFRAATQAILHRLSHY